MAHQPSPIQLQPLQQHQQHQQQQQHQQRQQQKQGHALPAFGHLRYDEGAYTCELKQSVGPGQYLLATPASHCAACLPGDARMQPGMGLPATDCQGAAAWVDVESDLQNLQRKASHAVCPEGGGAAYHPSQGQALLRQCGARAAGDCRAVTGMLPVEDTRLNNPPCTLRGTGWNRWEWLCQDPQDRALLPFDTGVNTSLVAKDNHRPHLPCPAPVGPVLPPARAKPPALSTEQPPEWAQEIMRGAGAAARVGDGIGADGSTPILAFRDCPEVYELYAGRARA